MKHRNDREAYTDAKAAFIEGIIADRDGLANPPHGDVSGESYCSILLTAPLG